MSSYVFQEQAGDPLDRIAPGTLDLGAQLAHGGGEVGLCREVRRHLVSQGLGHR